MQHALINKALKYIYNSAQKSESTLEICDFVHLNLEINKSSTIIKQRSEFIQKIRFSSISLTTFGHILQEQHTVACTYFR